ncbi:MAG: hypothetical protein AAF693_20775, partial [Bacteroidota bacterium]
FITMKKVMKVFMAVAVIALCGFTVAEERSVETALVEPMECVEDLRYEEEGIGCKVYKNGALVAKCFICNCAKLADQYN